MDQREFGTSGFSASIMGLGMAALGRPGYITVGHDDDLAGRTDGFALEHHAHEVLDFAHRTGVTYVDVARSYGRGEEFVSTWLADRSITPADVVVGSKWGYVYTAGWQVDADVHELKVHTKKMLDSQWPESAALLGSHLRLYQIHSATRESGVLDNVDVLNRLGELRDRGTVIGITTSGPDQSVIIRRALEVEINGRVLFGAVQSTWNLLEVSAASALAEASAAGLGVIVKEVVANGRLTSRDQEVAGRLAEAAGDWTPDALAIAAALRQPWSGIVLSGAATQDQLASNLVALDVPSGVLADLPDMAETPEDYWGKRSALRWA